MPRGTRVRPASSALVIDSMSEKGITARKYQPCRRMRRERVTQCCVIKGETVNRRKYAARTTPRMAIVRPGNEGVMATVITRRAINPKRKKVRLMTWARPYANVSRFGTGREQGSHLIRVRSWESELENGFDTAPILRGPGGNVADPRDRGRVAPSVNILSGLDGCYHKRAGIKIGPSTRIDCSSEISQIFLWGPPDTGPSRPRFPPGKTRRERTFSLLGGAGSHGRKHLPTVPGHSDNLQDGPGNPASLVYPGATAASGEPHRPTSADPRDGLERGTAEQRPHLREDGQREDGRREVHRERVPQGRRGADGPVFLPELRDRRHAVRRAPVDREQADRELPPADPLHGPFHGPGVQPPPGEARRGEACRDRRPR